MQQEHRDNGTPTEREQQLIALVAQGLKNHEVAAAMGTTEHVVKNYLRAIYDKLGLWNRVELALWHEARQFAASGSLPEQIRPTPPHNGDGVRRTSDLI
jgi:DNA-binding NarL/FixJ family response regulator